MDSIESWFLGPKAENHEQESELVQRVLADYFHWRRNYFPSDDPATLPSELRKNEAWNDQLLQSVDEMLAQLRRNFPFYSPRYIAHMLSDQTIPSRLGYFAGMLYNPNNVTPEAAPVTVDWELQVASDLLHMLGYRRPPRAGDAKPSRQEFGWGHLASGGTTANIEALWVARNVRYFPLAAQAVARKHDLDLTVKLAGSGESIPIVDLSGRQALGIRPNESIYLLARLVDSLRRCRDLSIEDASSMAWREIETSGLSIAHSGTASCFADYPPAIFVAGTAHYSIKKAADVLGLGKDNVRIVDVDSSIRMDIRSLRAEVARALNEGLVPLAVVAIAGTTEEGAVDPVHEILDFRRELESSSDCSFWLHIDAAWGGYLRTLFTASDDGGNSEKVDLNSRISAVEELVSQQKDLKYRAYSKSVSMRWGSGDVCSAFVAFPLAESITIDPHKMGYFPYPAGFVAYRNDRIRHFVTQEAPYISVTTQSGALGHEPPRTVGSYTLEGSRPGAAASSMWLAHRTIPPNVDGHGQIVRASLLAARELHEWLVHWEDACAANDMEVPYTIVPLVSRPPDTNLICFTVKPKGSASLIDMNEVTKQVYEDFTIEAELGDKDYSYSQRFFLSRTRVAPPEYPASAVADFLDRAGVRKQGYPSHGVFVLRATLMNPYLYLSAEKGREPDYLLEFMRELDGVACRACSEVGSRNARGRKN